MLTYLRTHMKLIMVIIAFIFASTMFYGLGYTGIQQLSENKNKGFLEINGKDVDPARFNNMFSKLRENFPDKIKPSDILFLQNMAISQTIDFSIILEEAKRKQRI